MRVVGRIGVLALFLLAASARAEGGEGHAMGEGGGRKVFRSSLAPERGALVGTTAANGVRGVPSGGLPWVLSSGHVVRARWQGRLVGELRADGTVHAETEGLVIDPNDPAAISRGVAGTNPFPTLKAIVSCLSAEGGAGAPVNVPTDPFPATATGDVQIAQRLDLPSPCFAPIVFVANAAGAWFAVTGF
jgi:hypothetical protein